MAFLEPRISCWPSRYEGNRRAGKGHRQSPSSVVSPPSAANRNHDPTATEALPRGTPRQPDHLDCNCSTGPRARQTIVPPAQRDGFTVGNRGLDQVSRLLLLDAQTPESAESAALRIYGHAVHNRTFLDSCVSWCRLGIAPLRYSIGGFHGRPPALDPMCPPRRVELRPFRGSIRVVPSVR
jgi:hypothetical protein